jgi:DNA-binding NarL/FixJ family response regulator
VRGAIRKFLEGSTKYKVCDEASDGTAAVQKAKESGCDLVLLDLELLTSGVHAAVSIRNVLPATKIVGFTTYSAEMAQRLFAGTGFDAILSKHDGLMKLVETLVRLLPAGE